MYRDSGGRVTDFEKAAMERVGRVDLALVAVAASYLNTLTVEQALEHMRTYKPDVYMPAHHDAPNNGALARDRAGLPGAQEREPEPCDGVAGVPGAGVLQHRVQHSARPLTGLRRRGLRAARHGNDRLTESAATWPQTGPLIGLAILGKLAAGGSKPDLVPCNELITSW